MKTFSPNPTMPAAASDQGEIERDALADLKSMNTMFGMLRATRDWTIRARVVGKAGPEYAAALAALDAAVLRVARFH